jgi:hypothetical protein
MLLIFFTVMIYDWAKWSKLFVPDMPFLPCLHFASKAGCSTLGWAPCLLANIRLSWMARQVQTINLILSICKLERKTFCERVLLHLTFRQTL